MAEPKPMPKCSICGKPFVKCQHDVIYYGADMFCSGDHPVNDAAIKYVREVIKDLLGEKPKRSDSAQQLIDVIEAADEIAKDAKKLRERLHAINLDFTGLVVKKKEDKDEH